MQSSIITSLLGLFFAFSTFAADKNGRYAVLSFGTKSCGEVVIDFKENGRGKITNSIWVAGYITAINERVANRSNIAAGTEPEAWNLWINNYCSANPLESLASSTNALIGELTKRNP